MSAELERPGRTFALLFSPPPARRVLELLLGIEQEIGAALRPGLEHQVAHVRLEWWREECLRYREGRAVHPLTRELAARTRVRGDPSGLVHAAVWDLAGATFATRAELTGYCERWAGGMTEIAAANAPDGASAAAVAARFGRALGRVLRELQMLCELEHDALAGRLRMPLDELEQAGVAPEALAHPPWPDALCELLRARFRGLNAELAGPLTELPRAQQPMLRGLLTWSALARSQAQRALGALPNSLPPARWHALSDLWHGWRAARAAQHRRWSLNTRRGVS